MKILKLKTYGSLFLLGGVIVASATMMSLSNCSSNPRWEIKGTPNQYTNDGSHFDVQIGQNGYEQYSLYKNDKLVIEEGDWEISDNTNLTNIWIDKDTGKLQWNSFNDDTDITFTIFVSINKTTEAECTIYFKIATPPEPTKGIMSWDDVKPHLNIDDNNIITSPRSDLSSALEGYNGFEIKCAGVANDAFKDSPIFSVNSSIQYIKLTDSSTIDDAKTNMSIGTNAFENCQSLSEIKIQPKEEAGHIVELSIGDKAFYGCKSLMGFTKEGAIVQNSSFQFSTIGSKAFGGCELLDVSTNGHFNSSDISLPLDITHVYSETNGAFVNDDTHAIVGCIIEGSWTDEDTPSILLSIQSDHTFTNAMFEDCASLHDIAIYDGSSDSGVNYKFEDNVFHNCTNLNKIVIHNDDTFDFQGKQHVFDNVAKNGIVCVQDNKDLAQKFINDNPWLKNNGWKVKLIK